MKSFASRRRLRSPPESERDRRQDLFRREKEILEITDDMPRDAAHDDHVVAVGDIVLQGPVFVELGAELIKVGDPDPAPQADPALLRFKVAEQDLEERGLAGAVGPDNAHLVAADDHGGEPFHDLLIVEGEADLFRFHNQFAAALRLLDRQPDIARLLLPARPLPAHLHQRPHPALVPGATGLDPLPNPGLFPGQFLVKFLPLLLLRLQHGLPAFEVRAVIAGKRHQAAPVDFHDACRQSLEKRPVMGHEHEGFFELPEKILEPEDGVDIQMVCGLVQKQKVRVVHQRPGQKNPAFHPRRQKPEFGILIQVGPGDHRFHPLMIKPGAGGLQPVLNPFELR